MMVDAVVFCFLIGKAEHMLQLPSETDKVEKQKVNRGTHIISIFIRRRRNTDPHLVSLP